MTAWNIKQFPDQLLRRVSKPVDVIDSSIQLVARKLIQTMRQQPGGIGIAAPQVGILKRIAIVDISRKVKGASCHVMINPVIVKRAQKRTFREGCMSLPDYTANAYRWNEVVVEWCNLKGGLERYVAVGIEAICMQHEVDHLDGVLFIDRVGSLKSDVFRRLRYL